jgi:signal recognition particle subunit SRP19
LHKNDWGKNNMRKQDKIIIWPVYFDSSRSRTDGRRVPKAVSVVSPRATEVQEAAQKLGFTCEVVPDVAYPKTSSIKTGMLLVEKKGSKNQTLAMIGKQLLKMRSTSQAKV